MTLSPLPPRGVRLRRLGQRTVDHIWDVAVHDPAWPLTDPSRDAWTRLVERLWASEIVDEGAIRSTWTEDGVLLGFVTVTRVPVDLCPSPGGAVECGTYLFPEARGHGWNPLVKRVWLRYVWRRWPAAHALFTIPARNERARRAFERLGWPHQRAFATPAKGERIQAEVASPPAWLQRFADRRAWETGEAVWVYAVSHDTELAVPPHP